MSSNGDSSYGAKVSVAMCTFNGGRYLREQLDSIAAQSRLPGELVVCDDGSTDDSLAILHQFQAEAPFFVRIVQNSSKLGSTRNFDQAIGLAQGEFIALCDQDDRWRPEKLERLATTLIRDPSLGAAFSDANLINAASQSDGTRLFQKHKFTATKQRRFMETPTKTLLKHDVVTGATLMFRSSMRPYCSPIPKSWVHDGWLAWMIALHSRFSVMAEPLIDYRIHDGQQLGVGMAAHENSPAVSTETRRQFYARVSHQFEDLLERLLMQGWSDHDEIMGRIREKIAFLHRQSTLSESLGARVVQMLGQLPSYLQYARGLGSLRTDFLLGREMM